MRVLLLHLPIGRNRLVLPQGRVRRVLPVGIERIQSGSLTPVDFREAVGLSLFSISLNVTTKVSTNSRKSS